MICWASMRGGIDHVCGCFPTGRHYPGIAERIAKSVVHVEGLWKGLEPSSAWARGRLAVIDFETTGLSPENDRVLEVGIACFEDGALTRLKNWLVNPGIPVPEEARRVHQIDEAELLEAPYFEQVLPELLEHLDGHLPVAYNADFDRRFLMSELGRVEGGKPGSLPPAMDPEVCWIDPLVWARELHKNERSHKLGQVCARLGIALEQAHRAAGDAEATGRVLIALAERMPVSYGELIRLQNQYAARQDVDMASWRKRRT